MGDSRAIAKRLFRALTWHSDDTTRHNRHLPSKTGFLRFGTTKTRKRQEKPQNYATQRVKTASRRGDNHKEILHNRAETLLPLVANRMAGVGWQHPVAQCVMRVSSHDMCVWNYVFGCKVTKKTNITNITNMFFWDTSDCIYIILILLSIVWLIIIYIYKQVLVSFFRVLVVLVVLVMLDLLEIDAVFAANPLHRFRRQHLRWWLNSQARQLSLLTI